MLSFLCTVKEISSTSFMLDEICIPVTFVINPILSPFFLHKTRVGVSGFPALSK